MSALLRESIDHEHPGAHVCGPCDTPVGHHWAMLEEILRDPVFRHVYFDNSWDLVASYVVEEDRTVRTSADLLNRYPGRFLFGAHEAAPRTEEQYLKLFRIYEPLWKRLDPIASAKSRKGNCERIFDAPRAKVRAWEQAHAREWVR